MMKICESCNLEQANILYYESVGGRSTQVNLCPRCAAEKGFSALKKPMLAGGHRLYEWRQQLEQAVREENFEEAARLRDLINDCVPLSPSR
jgi:protein-arginine kinase activator protein McsA